MTTYARFERKAAPLASDFGIQMASRWFAASILDDLPSYVRGPKKGTRKGWIVWDKCTSGGWHHSDASGFGGVIYPNTTHNVRIEIDHEVVMSSMGRVDLERTS